MIGRRRTLHQRVRAERRASTSASPPQTPPADEPDEAGPEQQQRGRLGDRGGRRGDRHDSSSVIVGIAVVDSDRVGQSGSRPADATTKLQTPIKVMEIGKELRRRGDRQIGVPPEPIDHAAAQPARLEVGGGKGLRAERQRSADDAAGGMSIKVNTAVAVSKRTIFVTIGNPPGAESCRESLHDSYIRRVGPQQPL